MWANLNARKVGIGHLISQQILAALRQFQLLSPCLAYAPGCLEQEQRILQVPPSVQEQRTQTRGRTPCWGIPELLGSWPGTGRSCWICWYQTLVCQSSFVPFTGLPTEQPRWECSLEIILEWGSILVSMGLSDSHGGVRMTGRRQKKAGMGVWLIK